jgi:5-methylthioribose kinase
VLAFLRAAGLARPGEIPAASALTGGVSSDIWKVDLGSGPVCVKRALPRLRVAQLWEAPVERNRYERRWLELAAAIEPGSAPKVLAADESGCFAMEHFEDLPLWKTELAAGRADGQFAAAVGGRLARIHAATADRNEIAEAFATDANFHAIRLEPDLHATAQARPDLAGALQGLAERTANTRLALVHGDVSPKNILVGPSGPVFLDAECAWYGDPAFDLAFCLNHLLLKCLWVPRARGDFLRSFDALWQAYREHLVWEDRKAFEARAASLLPGLFLARVDGKSPVEYLTEEAQKERVRRVASTLLRDPPSRLEQVRDAWQRDLDA